MHAEGRSLKLVYSLKENSRQNAGVVGSSPTMPIGFIVIPKTVLATEDDVETWEEWCSEEPRCRLLSTYRSHSLRVAFYFAEKRGGRHY